MDEQLKQSLMIGAIGCGFTIMGYQFLFNLSGNFGGFAIAILLGLVVGGIAFGIAYAVTRNQ